MKKIIRTGIVALFLFMSVSTVFAVNYPNHQNRMVNDFAGTLDAATKDRIEKKLRDFKKQTTNELAVVIVPDLQGENVDMFAEQLFKKWGIGKKGKDNGLLLLVSMKERKWRFEVGYGLEGVLTDGRCGQIARDNMVPYFKKGDFGKGIEEGLSIVISTIEHASSKVMSPGEVKQKKEEAENPKVIILIVIVLGLITLAAASIIFLGNKKDCLSAALPSEPMKKAKHQIKEVRHQAAAIPEKKERDNNERKSSFSDDDSGSSSSSSGIDFGGGSSGGGGASGGW